MGYELLIKISVKANKNNSYQKSDSLLIHVFSKCFTCNLQKGKPRCSAPGLCSFKAQTLPFGNIVY